MSKLNEYLKKVGERVDAATEGPWITSYGNGGSIFGDLNNPTHNGDNPYIGKVHEHPSYAYKPNGDFIAHARQDVEVLLEMVKVLSFYEEDIAREMVEELIPKGGA